jgi:hypothetical protein
MHDPVRPVLKGPSVIGWEAKFRRIDLVIERFLKGEELLSRMKGWFTVDVGRLIEILRQHGRLKVLDDCDLVVETESDLEMTSLAQKLAEAFGEEVALERWVKKKLA